MTITLHHHPLSPCVSSVLLTIRALGIDEQVTKKEVDLDSDMLLYKIPYLEDGSFCLWDSHAIVTYLANAYGSNGSLYPVDPKERAKVDQWLHFSSSILYSRLMDMTEPLMTRRSKVVLDDKSQRAEAAFRMIEDAIGPGPWLCGEALTLADLCCVSLVGAIEIFIGDSRHYPKMAAWVQHCSENVQGYQDVVEACRQRYIAVIGSRMTS